MSRRNRSADTAPESTEENTVTVTDESTSTEAVSEEAVEATAEAVADESVEQTADESGDQPAEAKGKKEDAPIDLTAFTAAIEQAVSVRSDENGDLPETAPVDPEVEDGPTFSPIGLAQAAYRDLDGAKAKNAAKNLVADRMKEALNSLDVNLARAYMAVSESLTAATGGPKKEPVPADPVAAFRERYQSHLIALYLVQDEAPEGVDVNEITATEEQVNQARALVAYNRNEAEDKGDAPEASAVVRNGVKLASGKASAARKPGSGGGGGGGGGPRRDIAEHIRQAFAEHPSGTFLTVADIRGFKSTEYGDDAPSAGAISARLFPSSGRTTLDFVTPGVGGANGTTRGATKN